MEKRQFNWDRPSGVMPYPNVWNEFTAKESKQSDNLVKYRIQDVPEDRFEDVIEFALDCFLNDLAWFSEIGGKNNNNLVEGHRFNWQTILKKKMCLVCFKENSDDIVGVNMMYVSTADDAFDDDFNKKFPVKEFEKVRKAMEYMYKNLNIYEKYNVENYLSTNCLVVSNKYRGLGIGQKLLESRKPLCQAFNVPMTHTIFSSIYSNRIADKVGFQLDVKFSCDEINREIEWFDKDFVITEEFRKENEVQLKSWKFDMDA